MLKLRPFLSIVVLALALVACGKKSNDPVAQGVAGVVQPSPYIPWPGGGPTYPDIQTYCQAYYGQLIGSICKFEGIVFTNSTYSGFSGTFTPRDPYGNYIQVAANDRVTVSSSGSSVTAYISSIAQGPISSFIATTSGYIYFQTSGLFSFGSVSQIRIKRCYVMSAGVLSTATCP